MGSIVGGRTDGVPVDVLIEYTKMSIDLIVHNREAVRHYLIDGDRVRRVHPVALSPRDFVDEWLRSGWDESAIWSASPALQKWHRKFHSDTVSGLFRQTTKHCKAPDLWQVTVAPRIAKNDFDSEPEFYFLVRWQPPYRFQMMNISGKPWRRCTQDDPAADEWKTMFSTQEWRR